MKNVETNLTEIDRVYISMEASGEYHLIGLSEELRLV
jgi:hypothetical protein